jgi:hypothetical protein
MASAACCRHRDCRKHVAGRVLPPGPAHGASAGGPLTGQPEAPVLVGSRRQGGQLPCGEEPAQWRREACPAQACGLAANRALADRNHGEVAREGGA